MKRVLVFLVVLLCSLLLCGCGESVIMIETPYCELALPEEFGDNVAYTVTSQSPYTIEFSTVDGVKLFALSFGGKTENLMGTLPREDGNLVLYATFYELDESSPSYDVWSRYQFGINTIIDYLVEDEGLLLDEELVTTDTSVYTIETSVVPLYYPNKWKDSVEVEVSADMVRFTYKEDPLFGVSFKECEDGYLVGFYKETPVYIVSYEIDASKYSEEENYNIGVMCHDINVILSYLMEDENFKEN